MQMSHDPENLTLEPNITSIGMASRDKNQSKHAAPSRSVCDKVDNRCPLRKVSAQLPQNLEWPHDTRATPERGAMRHTSQSSAALVTDGCVEVETFSPRLLMWTSQSWRRVRVLRVRRRCRRCRRHHWRQEQIGMHLCVRRGCGT